MIIVSKRDLATVLVQVYSRSASLCFLRAVEMFLSHRCEGVIIDHEKFLLGRHVDDMLYVDVVGIFFTCDKQKYLVRLGQFGFM